MRYLFALSVGCSFHVAPAGEPSGDGSVLDGRRADADPSTPDAPADAAVDAAPDAFVFMPSFCPVSYDQTSQASPGSRYRVITTSAPFAAQHADCADDHAGWTHLVVFDSQAEAASIGGMVSSGFFYVGVVQAPDQAAVGAGWTKLTGGPIASGWSTANPTQPEDGDEYVENNEENLAVAGGNGRMYDVVGQSAYRAVCECDGVPLDPVVLAYLP